MSMDFPEAWQEAEASVIPGVVEFYTLEFQHPAFLENSEPIALRIVRDAVEDQLFGIEDGAAFNAGEIARFMAIPFEAAIPEFGETKVPSCQIIVDGVNREMTPHLEAAVKVKADLKVIFRVYLSDDTSEPASTPVEFVLRNVSVTGVRMTGTATLDNLAEMKFPRRVYTVNQFPGLQSA